MDADALTLNTEERSDSQGQSVIDVNAEPIDPELEDEKIIVNQEQFMDKVSVDSNPESLPEEPTMEENNESTEGAEDGGTDEDKLPAKIVRVCPTCNKSYRKKSSFMSHMRLHRENALHCKVCEKVFNCKSALLGHMRSHTGETPFSYSFCEKSFKSRAHLKSHTLCHTGEKPFACPECGKSFSFKHVLKNHMVTHATEKPHVCTTCGKRFARRSSFIDHVRYHKGESPYVCRDCGRQFTARPGLLYHVNNVNCIKKIPAE